MENGAFAPDGANAPFSILFSKLLKIEFFIFDKFKKNELKPWLKKQWCVPPKEDADFVASMEKVLDLYQEPMNINEPLITMDELNKQLTKEVRTPMPAQTGSYEKYDFEYERNGTANIFMLYAPHTNWRDVKVTDQRTAKDWAELMHDLVYVHFPKSTTDELRSLVVIHGGFTKEQVILDFAYRMLHKISVID